MACRMPGVGLVTVSLRKSMILPVMISWHLLIALSMGSSGHSTLSALVLQRALGRP
jgi:hypothetical protein